MTTPQWAADAAAIDKGLGQADLEIEELKVRLKDQRDLRERLIMDLRETVRRQDEPLLTDQPKE